MIKFTVPGKPQGKGRPRFARRGNFVKTYTPAETENYEALIKTRCAQAIGDIPPIVGALVMKITAMYPIPQSWSKKKKAEALSGKLRPTTKPDADNIAKVVCDSLNEIAYRDDAQIVELFFEKYYSDKPQVIVSLDSIAEHAHCRPLQVGTSTETGLVKQVGD